jgi:Mn-dependent DtxR family transcriptional regulator
MVPFMMTHTQQTILRALFEMASEDQPADLVSLAARVGLSCTRTAEILDALDRAQLVDADRVRLTMSGLALAAIAMPMARAGVRAA